MCLGWLLNRFFPWRFVEAQYQKARSAFDRYRLSNRREDLQDALDSYYRAYKDSGEEHNQYPSIIVNYAIALHLFNQRFGAEKDQSAEVIKLFNQSLEIWNKKTPKPKNYPTVLINLGNVYMDEYRKTTNPELAKLAIEQYNKARNVEDLAITNEIRIKSLIGSATATWTLCELDRTNGRDEDLSATIIHLNDALALCDDRPDWRALCYQNLATCHDVLYQRHQDRIADLEAAIAFNKDALEINHDHAPTLFNLSKQYFARHAATEVDTTGRDEFLRQAEEMAKLARQLAEQGRAPAGLGVQIVALQQRMRVYISRGDTMNSTTSMEFPAETSRRRQIPHRPSLPSDPDQMGRRTR